MKPAILKRRVSGKNFTLLKGDKVYVAQANDSLALVRLDKDSRFEYPVPVEALEFVSEKVKKEIHVKRLPHRNDSMFYFGKHIATFKKGHREIFVESAGEMKAALKEGGKNFEGKDLLRQLTHHKITDRGLGEMSVNDLIINNNWFRLFDTEKGGEEEIAHTYDDAIKLAKQRINED